MIFETKPQDGSIRRVEFRKEEEPIEIVDTFERYLSMSSSVLTTPVARRSTS
jgi:hypothetical protein